MRWHKFIALFLSALALSIWFALMIKASTTDKAATRAITPAQHGICAAMPHGSQEMEDRRYECWHKLYGSGSIRISREILRRN